MKLLLPGRRGASITAGRLVPALLTGVLLIVVSAGAAAATETRTVSSFGTGLWWATSLITTVGFIGEPPETTSGAVLSAFLMVVGFLLLAMVSASLAALFVREEERPWEEREEGVDQALLAAIESLEGRIASLESRIAGQSGAEPAGPERSGPPPDLRS